MQIQRIQTKNKTVFTQEVSQTKSSFIPAHTVCAHLKYFTRRIHYSPLWNSEKRTVQYKQSVSCSSIESSTK